MVFELPKVNLGFLKKSQSRKSNINYHARGYLIRLSKKMNKKNQFKIAQADKMRRRKFFSKMEVTVHENKVRPRRSNKNRVEILQHATEIRGHNYVRFSEFQNQNCMSNFEVQYICLQSNSNDHWSHINNLGLRTNFLFVFLLTFRRKMQSSEMITE